MRIERFELRRVALPLVVPFKASWGSQTSRDVLLVRVTAAGADGWGECVAMNEPLYSSEYAEGAHLVMRDHLIPRLLSAPDVTAENVSGLLASVQGHRMAKAALETAILDAQLRHQDRALAEYLGGVRTEVEVGVSVGIADDVDALLETVAAYLGEGYRRVKLKIAPGWDVQPVRAVRERFPDCPLQVDANASYTLDGWAQLAALDPFGLLLIEQPLPATDLRGHAMLAKKIRTPICLDESITSVETAAEAIDTGATAIINVKAGRVGGYLAARRIHDLCASRLVPVWCGGMLETGIGRAANLALAALPDFTLPGDISASDRYFHQDLTPPFVLRNGRLVVPEGPGIGVDVLTDVVEGLTFRKEEIRGP